MTWSGGFGEITAEDVKYSFERIIDPVVASGYKSDWELLDHVEVVDKYTGIIVLKGVFAPLFATTLPMAAGAVVCKKAVEKLEPGNFGMTPPAQGGPYRIKQWEQAQRLILERNPDWIGPKPTFDEIRIHEIEDEKAAEVAYLAGELDATNISMTSIPEFEANMPPGSEIQKAAAVAYWWLGMQVEHPLYQDRRVRRAVQHTIDIQEVVDGAFFGVAEVATGMISPGVMGHREESKLPPRDLDKARHAARRGGSSERVRDGPCHQEHSGAQGGRGDHRGSSRRGGYQGSDLAGRQWRAVGSISRQGRRLEERPDAVMALRGGGRPELVHSLVRTGSSR